MLIKLLTVKDLLKLYNNKEYQKDTEKKVLNRLKQELSHRYEELLRMWIRYFYFQENMTVSMSRLKDSHIKQLIEIYNEGS